VDVAHGVHPAHVEKSDPAVRPVLGGGVVIKQAASQSYAGDAEAVAIVRELARLQGIPVQDFVNRSDSRGGSTLGSIASALVPGAHDGCRRAACSRCIPRVRRWRRQMRASLIALVRAVLA
jgi:aspartyl aminopeptidase